jgi:hypothetical protein
MGLARRFYGDCRAFLFSDVYFNQNSQDIRNIRVGKAAAQQGVPNDANAP